MKIKDYVHDKDRKIFMILFENINPEQVKDLVRQFQDVSKTETPKEDTSMIDIFGDNP